MIVKDFEYFYSLAVTEEIPEYIPPAGVIRIQTDINTQVRYEYASRAKFTFFLKKELARDYTGLYVSAAITCPEYFKEF